MEQWLLQVLLVTVLRPGVTEDAGAMQWGRRGQRGARCLHLPWQKDVRAGW